MTRRGLMGGLALLLAPGVAAAQMAPQPMPPSGAAAPPRQRMIDLSWDQIAPGKRRKLQQRLAGPGNPPMSADQARAMWDGMAPRDRRMALRQSRPDQAARRQRDPSMMAPPGGAMPPPGSGPMTQ